MMPLKSNEGRSNGWILGHKTNWFFLSPSSSLVLSRLKYTKSFTREKKKDGATITTEPNQTGEYAENN